MITQVHNHSIWAKSCVLSARSLCNFSSHSWGGLLPALGAKPGKMTPSSVIHNRWNSSDFVPVILFKTILLLGYLYKDGPHLSWQDFTKNEKAGEKRSYLNLAFSQWKFSPLENSCLKSSSVSFIQYFKSRALDIEKNFLPVYFWISDPTRLFPPIPCGAGIWKTKISWRETC